MTRVIIEPFVETTKTGTTSICDLSSGPQADQEKSCREWISTFHVEYFAPNEQTECQSNMKCTNLTKVELFFDSQSKSSNEDQKTNSFLVSIEPLEPPMKSQTYKESTTGSMRKFINSISSIYSSSYLDEKDVGVRKVWAMLNFNSGLDFLKATTTATNVERQRKPRIKISNFLRHQLRLFEVNPKVLVKAFPLTSLLEKMCLSSSSKKSFKLKTSCAKNVILF